ncbi:MAG: YihA family ribosome biogenesis GTP-binding protein [Chitinivibrionales bacterium]|nr:YihA family ribosome biogenesis GTP-binding protein [Chitinivibrionales bacterium]
MTNYDKINAEFVRSFAHYKDIFPAREDEYCLLGRSNVGKSSFLNHVFNRKHLAKVSKTPGKTSLANYFRLSNNIIWVDLPGYGYAKVNGKEKQRWSRLISDYCEKRKGLQGVIWLLDIRHPGTKIDKEAWMWLRTLDIPVLPVLTKCDKLSKNNAASNGKKYREIFHFTFEPVMYSIVDSGSRERFWKAFYSWRERSGCDK